MPTYKFIDFQQVEVFLNGRFAYAELLSDVSDRVGQLNAFGRAVGRT